MTSRGDPNEKGVRKVLLKLLLYLAAFAVTDSIQAYAFCRESKCTVARTGQLS